MYGSTRLMLELLAVRFYSKERTPRLETASKKVFISFWDTMLGDDSNAVLRGFLGDALALLDDDDLVVRVSKPGSSSQLSCNCKTDDTCSDDDGGLVVEVFDPAMLIVKHFGSLLLYGVDRW
jgi:hypothetical protein